MNGLLVQGLGGKGIQTLWPGPGELLFLGGDGCKLGLGRASSQLPGQFWSELLRDPRLAVPLGTGSLMATYVVERQDTGNVPAHDPDLHEFRWGGASHLGNAEIQELGLLLVQLMKKLLGGLQSKFVRLQLHGSGRQ